MSQLINLSGIFFARENPLCKSYMAQFHLEQAVAYISNYMHNYAN